MYAQKDIDIAQASGVVTSLDAINCAFLDTNYGCLIYEDRPSICRMYGRKDLMPCRFDNSEAPSSISLIDDKKFKYFEDKCRLKTSSITEAFEIVKI